MTKAQAIQLMIKGKKLVSTDVGFHYFYIQYKNDKFINRYFERTVIGYLAPYDFLVEIPSGEYGNA